MSGTVEIIYGAFSDYLEKALLAHVFTGAPYTPPSTLWAALFTNIPTDAAAGSEPPQAAGYDRIPVTFAASADAADGSSTVSNSFVVQFPVATSAWGTVAACGLMDAGSGGNLLVHGAIVTPKPVEPGDAVRFAANALVVGLQ